MQATDSIFQQLPRLVFCHRSFWCNLIYWSVLAKAVLFTPLLAQEKASESLQLGLAIGQSYNQIDFSFNNRRANPADLLLGQNYGLGLRYFNTKVAGFLAELNINQGGWAETLTQINGTDTLQGSYQRSVRYGELQLLSQFAFGQRLFRPFLQLGPYFGLPIADREQIEAGLVLPTNDTYFGEPLPNRFNYGLSGGAGLYLQVGSLGIQLEGRFQAAFRDSFRPGDAGISTSRRQAYGWRASIWYALTPTK